MCRAMAFYRTSPFSTPQPQSLPSPSIVGRRLHKFRLRLTTASVCGTIDCSLRLPTLIPDTAPSSRCRARCLNLRSQTISAFPFRCLFLTPPASGALHYNPVRNLRLLFRLVNAGLLLSELRSARSPYTRHFPPTHRGTSDGISTHGTLSSHVRDATLNAHSGREDNSLRARRHTFRTPFRSSQLHCSPTHEATSGAVSLAGKGESVKATSPPLCKGSFHWRLNALPHTPEASSPDKFPFRRLSFHCVAGVSNTFRAMPTQRPTHIDSTPTPDPDVRTADALTPFRLSVNLHYAQPRHYRTSPH